MKKVAVVMGGYSDEYKVSLKSGQLIFDSIDREKYLPYKVHILKGEWYVLINETKYTINKGDFSFFLNGVKIKFDVIFNIIHGTPGEDGYLQAYWDILEIPYTGCNHYLSALTFNKKDTLAVLSKYEIPMAKSVYLKKNETADIDFIVNKLGLPCFVKPNQSGSSLGITKVKSIDEFTAAFVKAFAEDDEILIEEFLDGTEVSVGVIQYDDKIFVSGITEIVSHNEFFDFEAKYEGASEEITPARLSVEQTEKVNEIAKKVYNSLRMSGMSRSEYIIVNGIPHFIEMNTLPGFSPASILPQQLQYSGISISDFVSSELETAILKKPSK
ncbi:MAG: D-alanine--D-alanine ligase [Flavobacteriaceae bacterium]|nr:D-alanine--D-alanine ligase [Flavobacteriaceae bacterium]